EDDHGVQKLVPAAEKLTSVASRDLTISGGGLTVDVAGNLYIAQGHYGPLANTVKKLAAGTGAITTAAGTGETYNGVVNRIPGPAIKAVVDGPNILALD